MVHIVSNIVINICLFTVLMLLLLIYRNIVLLTYYHYLSVILI